MNRLFRFAAPCALALLACAALAPAPALALALALADGDDTALTNLIALASQRLALAEPVARWKWANHQAITDKPREEALLADVQKRAAAANVDPAFARAFFQDQIDASKEVQNALFASWRASQPPQESPLNNAFCPAAASCAGHDSHERGKQGSRNEGVKKPSNCGGL
ncbi:MAG: Periplasmic chorismate mutase I precursor (EC, partial [uncultured Paraburkholderia sp.]